jgi:hypothetical protein
MYLVSHPGATPTDVRSALQRAAAKVANMGGRDFHEDYGFGRLDVERLLEIDAHG